MKLLKICDMLTVLILHANFHSLGCPSSSEIYNAPLPSITRILLQVICSGSSGLFIMISGWYGMHVTFKGFSNFIFKVVFFSISIYAVMLMFGKS